MTPAPEPLDHLGKRSTPPRSVRIPTHLWEAAIEAAAREGYSDVSSFLRDVLRAYLGFGDLEIDVEG